jgi:hypothetical protein
MVVVPNFFSKARRIVKRFAWSAAFWHDLGMSHSDRLFLISNSASGSMPRGGGGAQGARRGWAAGSASCF